ncbi:hypothetical protein ACF0H5_013275 [Mactra antiquata]
MLDFKIVSAFLILFVTDLRHVETVSQQVMTQTLFDDLMSNYSASLIPICNLGDNVTLKMDLALRQIMDVNEREQIITTNIWLRLTWNDCRLTWDPASYGNLSYLMVTYNDVWIPDITLYDSAAEEVMFPGVESYRAYVSSTGSVTYNFPSVTKSICKVNVKYFPFDTQECSLQFGSWAHHGFDLDVVNKNPTGDIATYIENSEWTVTSVPVTRHVVLYSCCPQPYPDVTFYVVMTRRPAFYLLTMIFPCILTSCVAALTFLLPVESGEKVSLEITVLLSLAVFLLLVSESLPPSSDNFPIIGSYFASSMVLVSLSLFQTVVVLNVFYRGTNGRTVPRWARKIFFEYLGKVLCIKTNRICQSSQTHKDDVQTVRKLDEVFDTYNDDSHVLSNVNETGMETNINGDLKNNGSSENVIIRNGLTQGFVVHDSTTEFLQQQTKHLKYIADRYKSDDNAANDNNEWREISNILDRVFLILYLFVMTVTTLAFILQCV